MRTWLLIILLAMLGRSAEAGVPQYFPIFQFAVFYNLDLEINPGVSMTINGRVHSNYNIYATGISLARPLIFSTNVEAVQNVYLSSSPLDPRSPIRSGNVIFSITNNNPQTNVVPLFSPVLDTNILTKILTIPPAGTDPTTSAGQVYLANQADIIITNSATTNLSVFYQNFNSVPSELLVPMDMTNIFIATHTTNTYYSFATNVTFYDYRESKTVKAVQFDAAKFGNWLTNASGGKNYQMLNTTGATTKGHGIDIVYVYNNLTNNSSQLPAVRVVNGSRLPASGLTVATPFPLYILGNYNTTTNGINFSTNLGDTANTYPAALMGDAITVLSANWADAYNASTSLASRSPTSTTINAATLQGIVPSNGIYYSGGLEYILRLEENWAGTTLTYNGSFVVLFASQYATAPWDNRFYYSVPTRAWGFDTNFLILAKLPPATPLVVSPYLISTNSLLEGQAAGSDSVLLTATIPWKATADASWLHLSAANQSGAGSIVGFTNVVFTFDANPSTSWRTGTLTIASQTITVTQMGIPFYYNLAVTNLLEGSPASGDSVILTANGAWTATANDSWLHLSAANQSGTGNATVIFTFDANLGATRTGTLTIAGQTVTVTQAGATYVAANPLIPLVTGLMGPRGIAVDSVGNLYIAETGTNDYRHVGNSAILKWTATNSTLTTLVTSNSVTPLYAPDGVTLDSAGNVYFSDPAEDKIFKWTAANSNAVVLVSSGLFAPLGVAVDGSGNVYVANGAFWQIYKYSWIGGTSNRTTLISSGLNNPDGLALDVAGNVYIADDGNKAVKEWAATSSNVTSLVSSGLSAPVSVAVNGSGNVYISDAKNQAIYKWTAANSNIVTLVSSGLSVPYGVAVDGVGNVYITDFSNNVVDELVYSFVDSTAKMEKFSAGNDVLSVVLPTTVSLTWALAPTSDSAWLTITGVTNGVVSFAFAANTGSSSRTANITLLGQTIPVTQAAVIPPILTGFTILGNGAFRFAFTNNQGASFTIWSTTNLALPMNNWTVLGSITNDGSGQYQFTDLTATNGAQCFYRVSSP